MPVFYVARKKIDKSGEIPKELYYAVPKTVQKRNDPADEKVLADKLAGYSSLSAGDVLSTLAQLPAEIAEQLKQGRTVKIKGLGMFFLSISSEGVERPEDCKPSTIKSVRICFKADEDFKKQMAGCRFKNLAELDGKKGEK